MKFAIITHVSHGSDARGYYAYAPYVREMNIWSKFVDTIVLVAPLEKNTSTAIDQHYEHDDIDFVAINSFNLKSVTATIRTFFLTPIVFLQIVAAMRTADHIHLRCPGNVGLLGCIAQVLFPRKKKSAKYAGNWDPTAKQPLSYKFQKWLLSNTFLTRNMQVLVYGEWQNQSKNIKPFFTATYADSDKADIVKTDFAPPYKMLFVGTLSEGKQPMYALKLVQSLIARNIAIRIDFYGDGPEKVKLDAYIVANNLQKFVTMHGNQTELSVRTAYKEAHFLILPSKSEGWPKVVAEAMFWGVVPIATPVSCVPMMLDFGARGLLLTSQLETDVQDLIQSLQNPIELTAKADAAQRWSRQFTTDRFETEIGKIIQ